MQAQKMLNEEELRRLYKKLITEPEQTYNRIIREIFFAIMEPGDIGIDVGANNGSHTVFMARRVAPHGKILAFEPIPENINLMTRVLEDKDLLTNVRIFDLALSNFTGESEFLFFKDSPGLSCFKERPWYNKSKMEKRRVKVDKLDNLVNSNMKIKFVKIDAEGADFYVMQGAAALIKRDRPVIIFESGRINAIPAKLYNYTPEEFQRFFRHLDYVLYDALCMKFNPALWDAETLNDYIAVPTEKKDEILEIIWYSAINVLSEKFGESEVEGELNQTRDAGNSKQLKNETGEAPLRIMEKKPDLKNKLDCLFNEQPKFHGREKAGTEHYPISDDVLLWIFDHLQPGTVTLETGCGYSTVVFALRSGRHTVISPFYQEHDVIKKWCLSHDIPVKNMEFIAALSQDVIHSLPADFKPDMVLIDGDHAFPASFIDWYYTADRLKQGGYVIVDDTHLRTGGILRDFLLSEKGRWEKHVEIGRTVIFKKLVSTPVVRGIPWVHQPFVNKSLSDE